MLETQGGVLVPQPETLVLGLGDLSIVYSEVSSPRYQQLESKGCSRLDLWCPGQGAHQRLDRPLSREEVPPPDSPSHPARM